MTPLTNVVVLVVEEFDAVWAAEGDAVELPSKRVHTTDVKPGILTDHAIEGVFRILDGLLALDARTSDAATVVHLLHCDFFLFAVLFNGVRVNMYSAERAIVA